ncbi:chaperone protein ClpD, chloroplastic [Tanacetum coccineum]
MVRLKGKTKVDAPVGATDGSACWDFTQVVHPRGQENMKLRLTVGFRVGSEIATPTEWLDALNDFEVLNDFETWALSILNEMTRRKIIVTKQDLLLTKLAYDPIRGYQTPPKCKGEKLSQATGEEGREIEGRPKPITPLNPTSNITSNSQTQFVTPVRPDMQAVDEAFVMANYLQLEPLMRKRMKELRLQGVATRLNYASDVDEKIELEASPRFRSQPPERTEKQAMEVYLSSRYIPDRYLPDKAIDLINEASNRARMEGFKKKKEEQVDILSKSSNDYWQEIKAVQAMHDVVLASKRSNLVDPQETNDETALASTSDNQEYAYAYSYSHRGQTEPSGIPVQQLTADERMLLVGLEERLKERVCGQNEAVDAICHAVKRSRVGLKDPDRPIAAMLFCGPTRVEASMLRLDMSEYIERHTISKLIGSPPGYVGYGEGGTLTEAIRKRPFIVVLLDEIEKAHLDIFNILLQIFKDGHLTDSQGRKVSFKNALVVMTSNVGSTVIAKGRHNSIGFMLADDESLASYAGLKSLVMEELKAYFLPELLNRIDEVVVFRSLKKTQVYPIIGSSYLLSKICQSF